MTLLEGRKKLKKLGFPSEFVEKAISQVELMNRKFEIDLDDAPIEVKIISSADGASHLVGPFYQLWFYENANKGVEELIAGNVAKAMKDWNREIVLPEVKKTFEGRHNFLLEQNGKFPNKFLK